MPCTSARISTRRTTTGEMAVTGRARDILSTYANVNKISLDGFLEFTNVFDKRRKDRARRFWTACKRIRTEKSLGNESFFGGRLDFSDFSNTEHLSLSGCISGNSEQRNLWNRNRNLFFNVRFFTNLHENLQLIWTVILVERSWEK